jgi:hypothetical protein
MFGLFNRKNDAVVCPLHSPPAKPHCQIAATEKPTRKQSPSDILAHDAWINVSGYLLFKNKEIDFF